MIISKKETLALKGISIVFIVIHNVVHNLINIKENEFVFYEDNVSNLFAHFSNAPISAIFSFWGWMGVSLFVFISGYGLTIKYSGRKIQIPEWIKIHYLKLFFLLLPALCIFFLYPVLKDINSVNFLNFFLEAILLLNIINPQEILPMIYWYIGMAFQLYIVFLLLRNLKDFWLILIGIGCCLLLAFSPDEQVLYLRHNCIGWLPEFIFGMMLAKLKSSQTLQKYKLLILILLSLTGLILFSLSRYTFILGGPCFVALLLVSRKLIVKSRAFIFLGEISAGIYVIHAIVRQIFYHFFLWIGVDTAPLLKALVVFGFSVLLSIPYQKFYTNINNKIPAF